MLKSLCSALRRTQNAPVKTLRKTSNEFCHRELTIMNFLVTFQDMASKREKIGSSFNPFPSLPSVTTDDRRQFQCVKIVLNNKTQSFL